MLEPDSIQYFAGYFDGEGSVCIAQSIYVSKKKGPQSHHSLRLQVPSTDPVSVQAFLAEFGGYVQFLEPKNPKWKPRWVWCACSREANRALTRMLPYLKVKRADAEIGLAFQALMAGNPRGKPVTEAMRAERDALRLRLIAGHGGSARSSSIRGLVTRRAGLVEVGPRRKQLKEA